ncbi:MAG: AAA family ATPase [Planctomycetes bacterium]|nr:AAA family ATPase [Planctomycetota bacterium]
MNPARSKSVLRYFLPADTFVRIHACEPAALRLDPRAPINRAGYRRAVLEGCCPELSPDVARRVADLCPHDPLAGEDLLYQLCIEVNPDLDIHTVRLPTASDVEAREAATEHARTKRATRDDWLAGLHARARGLEERLQKRVIGQDAAVASVVRAVKKAAAGLAEPAKPLASFLFVGRTGTGKTELARRLATELFGETRGRLVRVDCSEFGLAHEYSKLIGAPPGYVGHEHGGQLTDSVAKEPHSVVLFDEIEKAHAKLHHLLLQVLDEGHLTDSRGRRVDFSRTIVILTSNVGALDIQAARRRVGFGREERLGEAGLGELVGRALEHEFAPEFLGRIGERVLFRELDLHDAERIAGVLLLDLAKRARSRDTIVAFRPSVARWVAARGFSPAAGARELKRVVQSELEAPLAELLLSGSARNHLVRVSIQHDAPRFVRER